MTTVTHELAAPVEQAATPYVAPQLRLVGNLNDLLAGTGTQNTDAQQSCTAGAAFFNPDCS